MYPRIRKQYRRDFFSVAKRNGKSGQCVVFLWILFTLLGLIRTSQGADYYVSSSGNDRHPGTSPIMAWNTIAKVNGTAFKPGDRILFEGGQPFNGGLVFDADDAGTSTHPVTVSSYGAGPAVIHSGREKGLYAYNCAGFAVMRLIFTGSGRTDPGGGDGISFYTDLAGGVKLETVLIDSVQVSGYRQTGINIRSNHSSRSGFKNIRITNSVAYDNGDIGISVWGYWPSIAANRSHRNVHIARCKAFNNTGIAGKNSHTGNGIVISDVDCALIEYCEAYNNGELNGGSQGGPIGIWAWEASRVVIQFCESHHNRTANKKDGGGFDLDGGCVACILQYNYSHDNDGAGYGIYQFDGAGIYQDNIVRYNISENDGLVGGYGPITFWATNSSGGIQNTKVYNNTLYVSPKTGGAGIIEHAYGASYIYNTGIYNNIIITAPAKKVVEIPYSSGGWYFKGNCYWTYSDSIKIVWDRKSYSSLNAWRTATGQEMNSRETVGFGIDPQLTSPGNGSTIGDPTQLATLSAYRLLPGSPMIDAGLDLHSLFGINPGAHDFYGVSIPKLAGYDIGANESETITKMGIREEKRPGMEKLAQNFPNPFNPGTVIFYQIPEAADISLAIYNVQGQAVASLFNGYKPAGSHSICWDGRDDSGNQVSGGIYMCRMQLGKHSQAMKMTMVR